MSMLPAVTGPALSSSPACAGPLSDSVQKTQPKIGFFKRSKAPSGHTQSSLLGSTSFGFIITGRHHHHIQDKSQLDVNNEVKACSSCSVAWTWLPLCPVRRLAAAIPPPAPPSTHAAKRRPPPLQRCVCLPLAVHFTSHSFLGSPPPPPIPCEQSCPLPGPKHAPLHSTARCSRSSIPRTPAAE